MSCGLIVASFVTSKSITMPNTPVSPEAHRVLQFWLGDGLQLGWPSQDMKDRWFKDDAALDRQIKDEFGDLMLAACRGELQHWEALPISRLGLVILLDQFSRNIFRGEAQAFASDAQAQRLSLMTLGPVDESSLPWVGRVFLYMPLMHAEDLELQHECVRRFEGLLAQAPEALKRQLEGNLAFARQHEAIIARFGRFPYRNAALGRNNTAAEDDFLTTGPRFGQ
jgi:uncharacterized protein (DUF924 family)